MVLDAAYRFIGICLNDKLYTGPDLIIPLLDILLLFRLGLIALKADIKDMFLRVHMRTEDQDAQRFLWRGRDRTSPPKIYKMLTLLFGSKCSPCSAIYVKNKNAERFRKSHPRAVEAIIKRTYFDDFLQSVDSLEEAHYLKKMVTEINSKAGFKMHGWTSNHASLRAESQVESLDFLKLAACERALGLQWDVDPDTLTFAARLKTIENSLRELQHPPTKRQMLKFIMSVYDPLGFLNLFTVRAKILMQNVWRRGTSWDERLCEDDAREWQLWIESFDAIKDFKIPRCLYLNKHSLSTELHVFCDASEKAYATVIYWRVNYEDGSFGVNLVASKNYVTPLKPLSIPRFELQAAVIGARLAESVIKCLGSRINKKVYWSDSKTVLCWLKSDPRNYQVYVANRLGELDSLTEASSWRWVPSAENTADDATKTKVLDAEAIRR